MSESTGGSLNRTHPSQADEAARRARGGSAIDRPIPFVLTPAAEQLLTEEKSPADRATFKAASHVRPSAASSRPLPTDTLGRRQCTTWGGER